MCGGNILGWDYTRSKTGSYPLYPNLISKGYRIWIYSGDTDGAVPTLGTLYWINRIKAQMGLDTLTNWRGWY
jgi:serine carboxypeptidase-like clade 2